MPSSRVLLVISGLSGFTSVALGAFAAHFLGAHLDEYYLKVFRTGVEYQFYHALALGLVAQWLTKEDLSTLRWCGFLFVIGTVVFSGSLYLLALTQTKLWGAVTPIGGVAFLVGWILFTVAAATSPRS
jgi:uncharacterized membrane protein YgdD (TMEM256/DUF423 family)